MRLVNFRTLVGFACEVALVVACLALLSSNPGCTSARNQPSEPQHGEPPSTSEAGQIDAAIAIIARLDPHCGDVLRAKKIAGSILVGNMTEQGVAGYTSYPPASPSTPPGDPMPPLITIGRSENFTQPNDANPDAADFDCDRKFASLLIALFHEYQHASRGPTSGSDLRSKVKKAQDHRDIYHLADQFGHDLELALMNMPAGGYPPNDPLSRYNRRPDCVAKLLAGLRDARQAAAGAITMLDGFILGVNPRRTGNDVEDARVADERLGAQHLLSVGSNPPLGVTVASTDSVIINNLDTGSVRSVPTGIPITLDAMFVNSGRGLLLCGITGFHDPLGVVSLLLDSDGSGRFDQRITLESAGGFLRVPFNFASAPDGSIYVWDNYVAQLHRIRDAHGDGYPDYVEPAPTAEGDAELLSRNEINAFGWIDGIPVGYQRLFGEVQPNTLVALWQDRNHSGILQLDRILTQREVTIRPPYSLHPLFFGMRSVHCFGAPLHEVVIEQLNLHGRGVRPRPVGRGIIGEDNTSLITLSEPIKAEHEYVFHDTVSGSTWKLKSIAPAPFVLHLDNYSVPLVGGTITATGFHLEEITSVTVGDVNASITSQSQSSLTFSAPPKTNPDYYSISMLKDGRFATSPGNLGYSPPPPPIIVTTAPTLLQSVTPTPQATVQVTVAQVSGTRWNPLPNQYVVLKDADTGEVIGTLLTSEDGSADFEVSVRRPYTTLTAFVDHYPYDRVHDPGEPFTMINLRGQ